ncbi:MAG: hypothetical protein IPO02_00010 [Bacteroidetes bacterium]|nr:hypothetical protein [Bacteroidota bacterium]
MAEDTREDSPQFNQIKNEYTSRLTPISPHDQRHFEPSSNTKKYLFYKNNIELETIFDYPFYPEFNESKIIFLVDGTYEGNHDCPLNLSHSDFAKGNLTNSIDLENPEYKLKTLPTNIQVFINNDGAPRNLFSGDTIRKQDPLRIIWRREFHNDKQLDSTIADILKDLNNSKYNHVKIYNRDLTIYSRDDFDQREEKIKINTNKSDVIFSLEYNGDHINSDNNEYKFIGDEIGRKWKVEIHTPHFKANPDSIQPSDFSGSSRYISFNEFREYKNFDVRG